MRLLALIVSAISAVTCGISHVVSVMNGIPGTGWFPAAVGWSFVFVLVLLDNNRN